MKFYTLNQSNIFVIGIAVKGMNRQHDGRKETQEECNLGEKFPLKYVHFRFPEIFPQMD